jgi:hypothetical protein
LFLPHDPTWTARPPPPTNPQKAWSTEDGDYFRASRPCPTCGHPVRLGFIRQNACQLPPVDYEAQPIDPSDVREHARWPLIWWNPAEGFRARSHPAGDRRNLDEGFQLYPWHYCRTPTTEQEPTA